jgi:NAD+ synthase
MREQADRESRMAQSRIELSPRVLEIDTAAEVERIARRLRDFTRELRKRGLVVAISGGVDSSVCAALAVRALGRERVLALSLPERESSAESSRRAASLAAQLGLQVLTVDIAPILDGARCYAWRDEAVRRVVPEYGNGWRCKIVIRGGVNGEITRFHLVTLAPDGRMQECRLPLAEYLQIVAATSWKQRARKMVEYFHADRLNYAVVGTPNRLEFDQGFFVKSGDGAADVKPIAHLYKTQVYALAKSLGIPEEITSARPTTDTYSMAQGQDEFFFSLPYEQMDLALWARDHGVDAADLARALGIPARQAELVYRDIEAKRAAARYLHRAPLLVDDMSAKAR